MAATKRLRFSDEAAVSDKEAVPKFLPVPDITQDTPAEDAPIEDTPIEDIPIEDTPAEDTTPVEGIAAEDTPVEDTPADDTLVDDSNVDLETAFPTTGQIFAIRDEDQSDDKETDLSSDESAGPVYDNANSDLSAVASRLRLNKPVFNRLKDFEYSITKRPGTPPLKNSLKRKARDEDSEDDDDDDDSDIVDPIRAALTWQEDEITIYDPDDSDDDGTGINGIGFKPTPEMAIARTIKRKQQLAEYRRREDNEARAIRSMRRRGYIAARTRAADPAEAQKDSPVTTPTATPTSRRVRFVDMDAAPAITII